MLSGSGALFQLSIAEEGGIKMKRLSVLLIVIGIWVGLPVLVTSQQADFAEEEKFTPELKSLSESIEVLPREVRILDRREVTLPNLEIKLKLFKNPRPVFQKERPGRESLPRRAR